MARAGCYPTAPIGAGPDEEQVLFAPLDPLLQHLAKAETYSRFIECMEQLMMPKPLMMPPEQAFPPLRGRPPPAQREGGVFRGEKLSI
eukprot:3181156-Heterocapsa_arctica.AAC.1